MHKFLLLLLLFNSIVYSQSISFTGTVSDTLNAPLESANVIARPLKEGVPMRFAIADHKGRYRLELDSSVAYEITVSYLGYKDETFRYSPGSGATSHDFLLKPSDENLKEVVINYDYQPVVVKKDTLIYDVKSFASGNERKMKEVLEKLPGVEVDKNGTVTVQGKKVTQMLVEGRSFFGGGSRLAVENIPADALDKIEVIDHFNQVGFLKQVSDSDELAMNVKLKEEKKKFLFGDVEAALGNDRYYAAHAALFYYSPKTTFNFIGDNNNVGQRTLTFDDMMRFSGGTSSFLNQRKPLSNLYAFTEGDQEVIENKSQFSALSFSHRVSDQFEITGFGIFSKLFTASFTESVTEYLQNDSGTVELRDYQSRNSALMALGNIKLDYDRQKNEKWYYNGQYQFSDNDFSSRLTSAINGTATLFETLRDAENQSVKQYLEWHKSYSPAHTTTLVINQDYTKFAPENSWNTDRDFLPGLIPLQEDITYNVNQLKNITTNNVDMLFRHYWVINNLNHLYTVAGHNHSHATLTTREWQQLSSGSVNAFSAADGFGNDLRYTLGDTYLGTEYKFMTGRLITRPGLYLHRYRLATRQPDGNNAFSRVLLEPQLNSDYEFNKSESLKLSYRFSNDFADPEQMASRYTLQSYNSVFRGNAILRNERFHKVNLFYTKFSAYRGLSAHGGVSFSRKVRTIRNDVEVVETTQGGAILLNNFTTPVLTDNPETNWSTYGSLEKKFWYLSVKVYSRLSWFEYTQRLNGVGSINSRNSRQVGISLRTANKKWPYISVGYDKTWSSFKGITRSNYENEVFESSFAYEFIPQFTFKADYTYFNNTDPQGQHNVFQTGNISMAYQKKNSPWGFDIRVNNFLNNKEKTTSSFSDFTISRQTVHLLPRIILCGVRYTL
ncbi:hypothetical protein CHU92_13150 [Flavobacterium cyanobacteriorum]|uniref:TonB-dependent receptor n=1 Tax=Flavobacterium cyanobacteriorum TaxID=2022802 RepID=A0A255YWY8_9FLAO|nr:carboxypeptidase-like regulatory domain-containing protein [Flavobacterium cyanobacteriorum]OYQ33204.1 hypothetical protein CHU92_13150 [Flavobacterium cyanobacteriorum]